MRNSLLGATLLLLLAAFSLTQKAQALSTPYSGGHYSGGAALVIFMFGGLDLFGIQGKAEAPSSPLHAEVLALATDPQTSSLARQAAAGSLNSTSPLSPSELKALGRDLSLTGQIGR